VTRDAQEPDPVLQEVEHVLGRPLSAAELAPVGTLDDLPPQSRAIAAQLPGILRIWFLRKLVDRSERGDIQDYVDDVIDGDVPAAQWRRGGILLADFGLPDLLERPTADILGVIPLDGGIWRRRPVSRRAWETRAGFAGAPGVERPDLDRRFEAPPHVMRVSTRGLDLEPEDAPERRARRWIAARAAHATRRFREAAEAKDPLTLVRAVFPNIGPLSADATVALEGLLRERRELGPSETEVPGFRGPDDWYDPR
jgi:hypothetical protein